VVIVKSKSCKAKARALQNAVAGEIWKPIPSLDNIYEVSNIGRIQREGHILKPGIDSGRYPLFVACINGKTRSIRVHQVVVEVFIGPCPEGKEINHIDGIKTNNHAGNLEYVTRSENNTHALRKGLRHPTKNRGEDIGTSKLTVERVLEIKKLREETGYGGLKLSRILNLPVSTIESVIYNKNWGWLY
jgi:hypothetical protein